MPSVGLCCEVCLAKLCANLWTPNPCYPVSFCARASLVSRSIRMVTESCASHVIRDRIQKAWNALSAQKAMLLFLGNTSICGSTEHFQRDSQQIVSATVASRWVRSESLVSKHFAFVCEILKQNRPQEPVLFSSLYVNGCTTWFDPQTKNI